MQDILAKTFHVSLSYTYCIGQLKKAWTVNFLYRSETQYIPHAPILVFEVCWTVLIYVIWQIGQFCLAVAKAKKHLDIFESKHLHSNVKDTMAIGIYLYCCRHFYVQKLICRSKLATPGAVLNLRYLAFRSVIRKLNIIQSFSSSVLQVSWIKGGVA